MRRPIPTAYFLYFIFTTYAKQKKMEITCRIWIAKLNLFHHHNIFVTANRGLKDSFWYIDEDEEYSPLETGVWEYLPSPSRRLQLPGAGGAAGFFFFLGTSARFIKWRFFCASGELGDWLRKGLECVKVRRCRRRTGSSFPHPKHDDDR